MTFAVLLLAAVTALSDFSADIRERLEAHIRRVLNESRATCSVSGTVTGVGEAAFYLQRDGEAVKVACAHDLPPRPGDVVTVDGYPILEGGRALLSATNWRREGLAALPAPYPADYEKLTDASAHSINWRRVSITGRAIERTESGFAIDVEGLPITVLAERVPSFIEGCGRTRPKVTVCGVVEIMLDQSVLFGRAPYVMGVKMQVANVDDITLQPDAHYLMNVHDWRMRLAIVGGFVLLGVVLVALGVVLVRQQRRSFRTRTLMAERRRMADDIHDTIEQHLVGAGMLIQLNRNKEAREILKRAKSELRDIIWGLKNDDMMRLTPTEMLRTLVAGEEKKGIFRMTAKLEGLPEAMSAAAMRDLSLIVREAIGNAVKHGQAKNVAVVSDPLPNGGWLLRVSNDGAPYEPAEALGVADGHFGLEGMRERARRLGAGFEISVRKNGWTVVVVEKKGKS